MAKKAASQAKTETPTDDRITTREVIPAGGIRISPEDQAVLDKPIDDRMAALLKDHQRMGARPKTEPTSE